MKKFSFWKKMRVLLILFVGLWLTFTRPFNDQKMTAKNMLSAIEMDSRDFIDSTMGLKEFLAVQDSVEKVKTWKKARLMASPRTMDGGNIFRVVRLKECSDCNKVIPLSDTVHPNKYFIEFPGFAVKAVSNFFIEKDNYYVSYGSLSTPFYRKEKDPQEKIKQVGVRMAVNESSDLAPTSLLVPINESAYRFWNIAQYVIDIPLILISLFLCVYIPIIMLYRISNGQAFTKNNIRNLRLAGWGFIIVPMLPIFAAMIANIVLFNKIPKEIFYPYWLSIYEIRGWLIAGLVCLLFAEAFKRGYEMKKEQDLTI